MFHQGLADSIHLYSTNTEENVQLYPTNDWLHTTNKKLNARNFSQANALIVLA